MNLNEAEAAAHKERMLAEIRATRLHEMRGYRGLTQQDVADRMHVSRPRVAATENS